MMMMMVFGPGRKHMTETGEDCKDIAVKGKRIGHLYSASSEVHHF